MSKPYSSRLVPLSEWVLVRKDAPSPVASAPKLLIAQKGEDGGLEVSHGPSVKSRAVVVAVGPGATENGALVPVNPAIKPGCTILASANHFMQFADVPEMKAEGLYFIPASMICFVVEPAGMVKPSKATVIA